MMPYFIGLAFAAALSMTLIPLAMRAAPALQLVDIPNARKVHAAAIPRVGGIGIVLGALTPLLLWLPSDPLYQSYILASLVLFLFGLLDDRAELGHFVKFAGQFIAVGLVVFYGGLTIERFPLVPPESIDPLLARAFTFFALVGMINAANHSDGLDGLAGGLTLLTLIAMGVLAYDANGSAVLLIAATAAGGILGFLRYNSHPARVFMGDSGSQFLGLTAGFLAVVLTQQAHPALSPALPALLLGLPVIDIILVLYLRVSNGMHWFKATRNHLHHRLLDLGFPHQSTVVIIYSVQLLFVASAGLLRYQPDALILVVYLTFTAVLLLTIRAMERGTAIMGLNRAVARADKAIQRTMALRATRRGPLMFLALAVPAYFVLIAFTRQQIGPDFAVLSLVLFLVLGLDAAIGGLRASVFSRTAIFTLAIFTAFLCSMAPPGFLADAELLRKLFFAAIALAVALSLKFSPEVDFRTTSLDYLALFLIVLVSLFPAPEVLDGELPAIVVKAVILFFACEILLSCRRLVRIPLYAGTMASLALLGLRGLA